jgi:Na_pump_decarbB: sodium ion-translocating decarboxylase, beta subunit
VLGNLFEVSGVTARLSDTAQNALINIVTIFLATGTGLTMSGDKFLRLETIEIIVLGLIAFAAGTAGGVLFGQIMRIASGNKINRSSVLQAYPPYRWQRVYPKS